MPLIKQKYCYRRKTTGPLSLWRAGQYRINRDKRTQAPVPPAGEAEMRKHLGVWGCTPAGIQRALQRRTALEDVFQRRELALRQVAQQRTQLRRPQPALRNVFVLSRLDGYLK